MSFKMDCPHCMRTLNVTEEAFGKTVPCPGCNQPVAVPREPPLPPVRQVEPEGRPLAIAQATQVASAQRTRSAAPPARPGIPPVPQADASLGFLNDVRDRVESNTFPAVPQKAAKPPAVIPWVWVGGGAVALLLLVGLVFSLIQGARSPSDKLTNSGAFDNYVCDYPKFVGHIDFAEERNSDFYKGLTATDSMRLEQSLFSARCWFLSSFPEWRSLLNACLSEGGVDEVFMFSETDGPGVLVVRAKREIPMVGERQSVSGIEYVTLRDKGVCVAKTGERTFCLSRGKAELEDALHRFADKRQPKLHDNFRRVLESIKEQDNYVAFEESAIPQLWVQFAPGVEACGVGWSMSSSYDVKERSGFRAPAQAETYMATQKFAFGAIGWADCVEVKQNGNSTTTRLRLTTKAIRGR